VLLAAEFRDAPPAQMLGPVDDSRVAVWVVTWARFLAARFHAQATALHIVAPAVFTSVLSGTAVGAGETDPSPEAVRIELFQSADDWLTQLMGGSAERESMPLDLMLGDPADEIVAAARRMGADLIVMGSRATRWEWLRVPCSAASRATCFATLHSQC
jgi:nucleotide-binding universal stress UspA family protein